MLRILRENIRIILLVVVVIAATIGATTLVLNSAGAVQYSPELVIDGPETAEVGEQVECEANVQNLSIFSRVPDIVWIIVESSRGKVKHFSYNNSHKVVFGVTNNSRRYFVIAIVKISSLFFWENKELEAVKEINVGDRPGPEPDPEPDNPDLVDGRFGMSKLAYKEFPRRHKGLARDLARNFIDVADAIETGTLSTIEGVYSTLKKNNTHTIELSRVPPQDLTGFNSAIKERTDRLYSEKKLSKLRDFAELYKEIAEGLNHIK